MRSVGAVLGLVMAVGCGGSAVRSADDGAGGGAGSSSAGSSSAGDAGSIGSGGAPGTGGSISTGGTVSCAAIDCVVPDCPYGQLVTPPGQCCPVCSCDDVPCLGLACAGGPTMLCCPTCPEPPPASCENVVCRPPSDCPAGSSWSRLSGACCAGCVPDPGGVACDEIVCDDICPPGYVNGDALGGCCHDCVPDPLYCTADADCIIADRPRSCCGCPEVISTRAYAEDLCWSTPTVPHVVPAECYPDFVCGASCEACPEPGLARCVENRCVEVR